MAATETLAPSAETSSVATRPRLWEIDTLRGVAVVAMIFFHFMWDLQFLGLSSVNVFSPGWQMFARGIGTTFTFLLGVSLVLDAARMFGDASHTAERARWRRNLIRGAEIFGLGLLVSIGTYVIVGEAFVRFGILHMLGLAVILGTPFVRVRWWVNVLVGLGVIAFGAWAQQQLVLPSPAAALLIPFGFVPVGIDMVDYYPLAPWFGVALLGIAVGQTLYPAGRRRFALSELGARAPVRGLRFLGRHSLLIYIVHQPILIGMLYGLMFLGIAK